METATQGTNPHSNLTLSSWQNISRIAQWTGVRTRRDSTTFLRLSRCIGEVEAPIPPELIATLLSLYNDVYLRSEREVTLEEVFFNHYGNSQYRTKWKKEDRDALDDLSVAMDTQFHGLSKTEAAERRGEWRGVTGNAVLSNIRRKRKQRETHKEDK